MHPIRTDGGPEYTVVMRAVGAIRIPDDRKLCFQMLNDTEGPREVIIRALRAEQGFDVAIPRGVDIEVHGAADSFEHAREKFPAIGVGIANMLSLACNAFAGDPRFMLAFECTPGVVERQFYQQFRPLPTGMPPQGRFIDVDKTGALLVALAEATDAGRLGRAVGQYHLALSYWEPGYSVLALGHLFMAVEALTPAVRRTLCAAKGKDQAGLADEFGIDPTKQGWQYALDGAIKERVIFDNDQSAYREAKQASDGLEHGFMEFSELRTHASDDVRKRTARHVRRSILSQTGLDAGAFAALTQGNFSAPLDSWELTLAVKGFVRADATAELLHELDSPRPQFEYDNSIKTAQPASNGQVTYSLSNEMTSLVPPGVFLSMESYEVWGPDGLTFHQSESDVNRSEADPPTEVE